MTKVKICGITNLNDAVMAIEFGADMLGFNFYPPSPRSISPEKCSEITDELIQKHPGIILVGVFVNMESTKILNIKQQCSLHLAQLHGDESELEVQSFAGFAYKAFRGVPDEVTCRKYVNPFMSNTAPAFLVDAAVKGLYGGSGVIADWNAAASLAAEFPILLAGGLTPENVIDAIRQVRPWGVDTASGVESAPGVKDAHRLESFVNAVRSMERGMMDGEISLFDRKN